MHEHNPAVPRELLDITVLGEAQRGPEAEWWLIADEALEAVLGPVDAGNVMKPGSDFKLRSGESV